jgi:hypothetical protein
VYIRSKTTVYNRSKTTVYISKTVCRKRCSRAVCDVAVSLQQPSAAHTMVRCPVSIWSPYFRRLVQHQPIPEIRCLSRQLGSRLLSRKPRLHSLRQCLSRPAHDLSIVTAECKIVLIRRIQRKSRLAVRIRYSELSIRTVQ